MSSWPNPEGSPSAGAGHACSGSCPVHLRRAGKEPRSGTVAPACRHMHARTCVPRCSAAPQEGRVGLYGGHLLSGRVDASPVAALQDAFIIPNRRGSTGCNIFHLGNRQQNGELHLTVTSSWAQGPISQFFCFQNTQPSLPLRPHTRHPELSGTASPALPRWTKVSNKDSPALAGD